MSESAGPDRASPAPTFGQFSQLGELADPSKLHDPIAVDGRDHEQLLSWLWSMKLIRRTEEVIGQMVTSGEVSCPCHLAIGQEACAVGVAATLDVDRDVAFGAHRSHGHYLALGASLEELLAEVLGRTTGCSRGMGGSMHLTAPTRGLLGTVPIVGATVPMAIGAALAARMNGKGGVAVAFFGDGAMEEGVVQEALNFAAAHSFPTIFVCENNLFSSHLQILLRQRGDRVGRFAEAHGVPCWTVDGNDVTAVHDVAIQAVDRARSGNGPGFLELVTYRWRGHVGPREDLDVGVLRSGELQLWKRRDPIDRLAQGLLSVGIVEQDHVEEMDREIREAVEAALGTARSAPFPEAHATTDYLYSGGTR